MSDELLNARFFLAPMDGVTDFVMRDLLTQIGGIDVCVSEFLRVAGNELSKKVVHRDIPESAMNWRTYSGTPVIPQILGGSPELMAQSAYMLAEMGAPAIDINFGCPAKTVNRHDGGAVLLNAPDRVTSIIRTVKEKVFPVPVSAKIRLGWDSTDCFDSILNALIQAQPKWITIHARTKTDGYSGAAKWDFIKKAVDRNNIPVIANGDIVDEKSYQRCLQVTGSQKVMIGRAVLKDPFVFRKIRDQNFSCGFKEVTDLLNRFNLASERHYGNKTSALGRLKRWSKQLSEGPYASIMESIFDDTIKHMKSADEITGALSGISQK